MSGPERVSDSRLNDMIDRYAGDFEVGQFDRDVLAALRELRANRRGEFICSRCYLRKDGETTDAVPF